MPDWKILVTDGLEENGLSLLRASALVDDRKGISPEELSEIIGGFEAPLLARVEKLFLQVADLSKLSA